MKILNNLLDELNPPAIERRLWREGHGANHLLEKDTDKDCFQKVREHRRYHQAQQRDMVVTIETKTFEFNIRRVPDDLLASPGTKTQLSQIHLYPIQRPLLALSSHWKSFRSSDIHMYIRKLRCSKWRHMYTKSSLAIQVLSNSRGVFSFGS